MSLLKTALLCMVVVVFGTSIIAILKGVLEDIKRQKEEKRDKK